MEWRRAAPPFDRAPIGRVELERCSTIWRSPIAERACLARPVESDRDVEPRSDLMAWSRCCSHCSPDRRISKEGHRILVSRLESCPPHRSNDLTNVHPGCRRRALPSFDARGQVAWSARPRLPGRVARDASRADARAPRTLAPRPRSRRCCSNARGRSTRSACASRSRWRCSTASSSSGRSGPFDPAGSCSRGSAPVTSSSAPRAWTCGPATGSGSSRLAEGPGGRPLYFPALPPGRGRGAAGPGPHRLAA